MKWITREHIKEDRVACPWSIRRFIDPQAQFLFVEESRLLERKSLFAVSPSCGLRLLSGGFTDFVAKVRDFISDVGPGFLACGWCDEQADAYPDANSNHQSTDFAEYVGLFFATKSICGSTDAVGRGVIRIPEPILDVIDVIRQTLTKGIDQMKSGSKQYIKKWFSSSGSHICVSCNSGFADMEMRKPGEVLAERYSKIL